MDDIEKPFYDDNFKVDTHVFHVLIHLLAAFCTSLRSWGFSDIVLKPLIYEILPLMRRSFPSRICWQSLDNHELGQLIQCKECKSNKYDKPLLPEGNFLNCQCLFPALDFLGLALFIWHDAAGLGPHWHEDVEKWSVALENAGTELVLQLNVHLIGFKHLEGIH